MVNEHNSWTAKSLKSVEEERQAGWPTSPGEKQLKRIGRVASHQEEKDPSAIFFFLNLPEGLYLNNCYLIFFANGFPLSSPYHSLINSTNIY